MTELERNPYPVYERLRAEAPIAFLPVLGAFVASTTEACRTVANSDDFEGIITLPVAAHSGIPRSSG